MAPVIWGLDLADIRWGKFKSSYMWNTDYHLRRTKFIVYQIAMILCVASESLGTAALEHYNEQQERIQKAFPDGGYEYNNDFVGIASYNIFVGVYIAIIFGSAFFFDLIWPERYESWGVRIAWRCCSVAACLFALGDAIALTVVVVDHAAYTKNIAQQPELNHLESSIKGSPLEYKKNGRALASLVILWLAFPIVVASTVVMWVSLRHDERQGPFSTHKQEARDSSEGGIATNIQLSETSLDYNYNYESEGGAYDSSTNVARLLRPDGVER